MNYLEEYYGKFNEEKRFDSRHGQVEFIVTMRYVHRFMEPMRGAITDRPLRLIDIGAGTGRYAVPLADEGLEVCAVEPVKHNLSRMKAKSDRIKCMQRDARDMHGVSNGYYDIALMLGPMYHLFSHEDKLKALKETIRVMRTGGVIFVGYCMNEYAVVTYALNEGHLSECLQAGRFTDDYHTISHEEDIYDYVRIEDIDRLMRDGGLKREILFSPDGPTNYIRKTLKKLSDEEFDRYVDYVASIAERHDLIGAAAHTVDVLKVI
jgi:ubiquinone/menaquinone biosynthesis C-methylase UbiE